MTTDGGTDAVEIETGMEIGTAAGRAMSEQEWEQHALGQLTERGWQHIKGKDLHPRDGHRKGWEDLVLYPRLRAAITSRHPELPSSAVEDAIERLLDTFPANEVRLSWAFYQRLKAGVKVSYTAPVTQQERHVTVRPVDFTNPHGNDLVAANQVRVKGARGRVFIFDIVLYVNGLPVAVIELKKAGGTDDSRSAYDQIQNYRRELKLDRVFRTLLLSIASDGITARLGTPYTPWQHMSPWHAEEDGTLLRKHERNDDRALDRMIHGALEPDRFLDLIANFLSYSAEGTGGEADTVKLAKAHQYVAVKQAIAATSSAVATDGRAGVVWHTQGAGKSEEMLFYTGLAATIPKLPNPTVLLLTDRIDLDSQLFDTFAQSKSLEMVGGSPQKATRAVQLRELMTRRADGGGIVFSTLQKFRVSEEERMAGARHSVITDRRDVIVVVDEAHRSHYDLEDGFARNLRDALPNATFIAFTGTPIDNRTGSTRQVFGPTIHTYDLTQAVDDGATVPVYYEPILHKVTLPKGIDLDELNAKAEGLVEGLGADEQARARKDFARFEDLIGAHERIGAIADTILSHWDIRRQEMTKLTGSPGKAMIVCSSRRNAARLFRALVERRREWTGTPDPESELYPDDSGKIRVVFTGNPGKDTADIADYVRTPAQLKKIQERVGKPEDELELIIVQSLWLTGFDAPPLHTMYLDRRMRGAALMQAIARVNRTWDEKPSGLIVDFLGVGRELKYALATYSEADQEQETIGAHIDEAVKSVRGMHGKVAAVLRDCPWRATLRDAGYREALREVLDLLEAAEPALQPGEPTRAQRFLHFGRLLSQAFSLCPTHPDVQDLLPDIHFFATVRTTYQKLAAEHRQQLGLATEADVRRMIEQLNAEMVAADGVVDIYDAAGLTKPDLSHLDAGFVQQLKDSRHPNLALKALRDAIAREIREAHPSNLTRQKEYSEEMKSVMNRYHNGLIGSAEAAKLLIEMAQEVSTSRALAAELGLTEHEMAFYDAIAANPKALEMGKDILSKIAHKLYEQVADDVTIDWRIKSQAQDRIRAKVKLLLNFFGYPPDEEPGAVDRVLKQTEVIADDLV
ncbi:type I restriction endonuclease subunit R [Streptomyces sp. NPDC059002]|uniref:type I restriction endonuclease subunit R n=1 Tax=Streptomyces sp. NPDC059002 TaxID=3346690 RepID=UPI00369083C9